MADLGAKGIVANRVLHSRPVVSPLIYKQPAPGDVKALEIDVDGSLSGIVRIAGVPTEGVSLGLFHRSSLNLIARATSNNTGAYIFRGLDRSDLENYFVLCLDPQTAAVWNYTLARDHLTAG